MVSRVLKGSKVAGRDSAVAVFVLRRPSFFDFKQKAKLPADKLRVYNLITLDVLAMQLVGIAICGDRGRLNTCPLSDKSSRLGQL